MLIATTSLGQDPYFTDLLIQHIKDKEQTEFRVGHYNTSSIHQEAKTLRPTTSERHDEIIHHGCVPALRIHKYAGLHDRRLASSTQKVSPAVFWHVPYAMR